MNAKSTSAPGDAAHEVEKVATFIETAKRLLAEGKMIDLTGLQRNVDVLCRALREAPPEEAGALKESVADLLAGLDLLAAALSDQYAEVSRGLERSVRRTALAAYDRTADES